MSVEQRLKKAEQMATALNRGDDGKNCTCPDGKKRFYFIIPNMTEEEAARKFPDNLKYCLRCGGLNIAVYAASEYDLRG